MYQCCWNRNKQCHSNRHRQPPNCDGSHQCRTSTPLIQSNSCNGRRLSAIILQLPSTGYAYNNLQEWGNHTDRCLGGSGGLLVDSSVSTSTPYSYQIQASTTIDGDTHVSSSSTPPISTTTLACIVNNNNNNNGNTVINTGSCTPNQTGAPAGKVYVDRQMIWAVPGTSGFSNPTTVWSGDNWNGLPSVSGTSTTNIYTTVGTKYVYATTTPTPLAKIVHHALQALRLSWPHRPIRKYKINL